MSVRPERVMAPDRPRLARALTRLTGAPEELCLSAVSVPDPLRHVLARQVMSGTTRWSGALDAREAWEAVAPDEWLTDGRPRFVHGLGAATEAYPPTTAAALCLAADPQGISAAESLALELLDRVWRHLPELLKTPPRTPVVAWSVVAPRSYRSTVIPGSVCRRVPEGSSLRVSHPVFPWPGAEDGALRAAVLATAWRVGACAGEAAEIARCAAASADDPDDPIHPLAALWDLGYALDAFNADQVTLAAPSLSSR